MQPQRAPRPTGLGEADFQLVRSILLERAGIAVEPEKDYLIEMRLATLASEEQFAGAPELVSALRAAEPGSALRRRLVECMTISETSFFRDVHPFDALRETILPRLFHTVTDRPVRIWSAACATGQEPYSVAMTAIELLPWSANSRVRILATDYSRPTLRRAAAGQYTQAEINRGLPIRNLIRFFIKEGDGWRLRDEVRALVEFRELNLSGPWPITPEMDVILLRNVLIYLDEASRRSVLSRAASLLAPDGCLIVGTGESGIPRSPDFESEPLGRTVIFRPTRRGSAGGA